MLKLFCKPRNAIITTILLSLVSVSFSFAQNHIDHHVIKSKNLSETRLISVSLPKHYKETTHSYPVLFVLDGDYMFDYAKGTVDFLSNDFNYFPEMIVVGIPNTNRHRDLFVSLNSTDGYVKFLEFLEQEVITLVAETYRTNGFNILYGWSSGSGICNYLLVKRPQLFNGFILTGSGIGPKTATFIEENLSKSFAQQVFLYANAEDKDPRKSGLLRYKELLNDIDPKGLDKRIEIIPNSNHVSVMTKGLYAGLEFIFSDFNVSEAIKQKGVKGLISHYKGIHLKYGVEFEVPIGAINETAGFLTYQGHIDMAIELLEYGITLYPNSGVLCGSLAEIYKSRSNKDLARYYYHKAREVSADNLHAYLKYDVLYRALSN